MLDFETLTQVLCGLAGIMPTAVIVLAILDM